MFGYFHFRVSQIHYVVMSLSDPVFGVKYLTYFCGFSKLFCLNIRQRNCGGLFSYGNASLQTSNLTIETNVSIFMRCFIVNYVFICDT